MQELHLRLLSALLLLGSPVFVHAEDIRLSVVDFTVLSSGSTGVMVKDKAGSKKGRTLHFIPGSKLACRLKVKNNGRDDARNCTVLAPDWPSKWGIKPKIYDVPSRAQTSAEFEIFVPKDAVPGTYTLKVTAYHRADGDLSNNEHSVKVRVIEDPYPMPDVDRSHRKRFVRPTDETRLNAETVERLKREIPGSNDIVRIGKVYLWIERNLETGEHAGGEFVATRSAQQMLDEEEPRLTGCNDWGIMVTSILRSLGYPVVFMNGAKVAWAKRFREAPTGANEGHVFLEIFVNGKWIVMDSTSSRYTEDYDHRDPVVCLRSNPSMDGTYFIYQKGRDHWTIGVRSVEDNRKRMERFARHYPLDKIKVPRPPTQVAKLRAQAAGY